MRASSLEEIRAAINYGIQREIDKIVEEAVSDAKKEVERVIPQLIGGAAIQIQELVRFDRIGPELVIHVKLDK